MGRRLRPPRPLLCRRRRARREDGRGTAAAGAGVLGNRGRTSSSAGAETATVQPVIAKGHLPFSGLALARDLVLGLALMLVGLFTRALSASEGRRRL